MKAPLPSPKHPINLPMGFVRVAMKNIISMKKSAMYPWTVVPPTVLVPII